VRSLDVSGYDVVISNSHSVAKGIRTRRGQLHVCYCLSPMRYAWDLRDQYLRESGLDRGLLGLAARMLLERMRRWDQRTSRDVDVFVTLSNFIADRIKRAYGRSATVIYPPVETDYFTPGPPDPQLGEYYFTVSRFAPYKRIDLIARAFAQLPDRKLIIAGSGPDAAKIRAVASSNVTLAGQVSRGRLRTLLRGARAFVFAAEEDFGIAPVEAQSCGIPVIAFGKGGALETIAPDTGLFFDEQTSDAIAAAIASFERRPVPFDPQACRSNAERFSEPRFRREIAAVVAREWAAFPAT
jgi:O-antigen biosynthesis alpha-1,3-mannosyltransferase